jgi:hypothetical protein
VIHHERQVRVERLANRLAVVDGIDGREKLEVLLRDVGDSVENIGPLGGGGLSPSLCGVVCGIWS